MREDKKLKTLLILQSFSPLFALLLIRHAGRSTLLFSYLNRTAYTIPGIPMRNPAFGDDFITIFSTLWILITIIIAIGFRDLQKGSFDSYGESVIILDEKKDSGATFLVTFVLPLLIDDVTTISGLISFMALLFDFQFTNHFNDVETNKTYVGITKGDLPIKGARIKRRYIADNVFLIYYD